MFFALKILQFVRSWFSSRKIEKIYLILKSIRYDLPSVIFMQFSQLREQAYKHKTYSMSLKCVYSREFAELFPD